MNSFPLTVKPGHGIDLPRSRHRMRGVKPDRGAGFATGLLWRSVGGDDLAARVHEVEGEPVRQTFHCWKRPAADGSPGPPITAMRSPVASAVPAISGRCGSTAPLSVGLTGILTIVLLVTFRSQPTTMPGCVAPFWHPQALTSARGVVGGVPILRLWM